MFIDLSRIPETGNRSIDAAHGRLAQIVNRAYEEWQSGAPAESFYPILLRFVDMAEQHFADEVALIRDAGYAEWENHQAIHEDLVRTLRQVCRRMDEGPSEVDMVETFTLIDRLFYEHEFLDDQDFWEVFREEKHALDMHRPLIAWQPSYEVGIPAVDHQHKTLVKMLNRLHLEIESRADREEVVKQLSEVMAHTRWHFETEETLMRETGDEGYAVHKILHDHLLEELRDVAAQYAAGHFTRMEDLLETYLKYWLLDHITNVDMKLAKPRRTSGRSVS